MRQVIVRYKIKPEHVAENERLIAAVFAQLQRDAPAGLRYTSFKLDDGASFVHVASVETSDGSNPLVALEAFRQFSSTIKDRCEEPPMSTEAVAIGSYRMLGT